MDVEAKARELPAEACRITVEELTDGEEFSAVSTRLALRALTAALTPEPPNEEVVERAAEALAQRRHGYSLAQLEEMAKGGRVDDCRADARIALSAAGRPHDP